MRMNELTVLGIFSKWAKRISNHGRSFRLEITTY